MLEFELESNYMYEGSYTDGIFSGTVGNRTYLGSNVSGAYDGYLRSLTDFGLYSNTHILSGNQINITNHSPTFLQMNDASATYFDSYVPNFDDVMNLDAFGLVLTNVPNPSGYTPLSFIYPITTYHNGSRRRIHELLPPSRSISNDFWAITPPFSQRYRNIRRVRNVSLEISSLFYKASCSFGTTGGPASPTPRPFGGVTSAIKPATGITYDSNDTTFWGGVFLSFINPVGTFSPAFVIQNGGSDYFPKNQTVAAGANYTTDTHILLSMTGSVNTSHHFSAGSPGPGYPPATWSTPNGNPQPSPPHVSDTIKALYGFGNGPSNVPWFSNSKGSSIAVNSPIGVYARYGTQIRGWKYGLINAFPTQPKAIFRRSHYGHLRDMLEQQKYSKLVFDDGSIEKAVEVIFVSGSQSALTASNLSLNPYDSGIYDVEYRSGQWYTDI